MMTTRDAPRVRSFVDQRPVQIISLAKPHYAPVFSSHRLQGVHRQLHRKYLEHDESAISVRIGYSIEASTEPGHRVAKSIVVHDTLLIRDDRRVQAFKAFDGPVEHIDQVIHPAPRHVRFTDCLDCHSEAPMNKVHGPKNRGPICTKHGSLALQRLPVVVDRNRHRHSSCYNDTRNRAEGAYPSGPGWRRQREEVVDLRKSDAQQCVKEHQAKAKRRPRVSLHSSIGRTILGWGE